MTKEEARQTTDNIEHFLGVRTILYQKNLKVKDSYVVYILLTRPPFKEVSITTATSSQIFDEAK